MILLGVGFVVGRFYCRWLKLLCKIWIDFKELFVENGMKGLKMRGNLLEDSVLVFG